MAKRDDLSLLESRLYRQLLVLSLAAGAGGFAYGGFSWALAACLGPLVSIVYFRSLAVQTRRVVSAGRVPAAGLLAFSVAGRQAVCMAAPGACWYLLGEPWLACLATLVVARHWIVVTARPSALPAVA